MSAAESTKRRVPSSIQRLAKLSSLAGLPAVHADQDILHEISPLLSTFGASPEFIAPNADNTGFYALFNQTVFVIQLHKKWELGSIEDHPAQHTVPCVAFKEKLENISSFVTSSIDYDFVYLLPKDNKRPHSIADTDFRWLRFQSHEHTEEFLGHCLSVCAPHLLSKARMLVFQSGGAGTNFASLSATEIATETEKLASDSERTIVLTDLVVRSVSDVLSKVRHEVGAVLRKSTAFAMVKSAGVASSSSSLDVTSGAILDQKILARLSGNGDENEATDEQSAPHGIRGSDYDFQHVARNEKICSRMVLAEEKKVLFSSEVYLTDHTHEMAIISDVSLRIEKLRKDRTVYVIPFAAIEELVVETDKESVMVLIKVDFSICTSIRGDVTLRFPAGPNGIRMKSLFLQSLTSAYEAVVVSHLKVLDATDVFWSRRGTLESQLVRMMKAIRPSDTPATSMLRSSPAEVQAARLVLYLCLKQPAKLIYSLSASSAGVDQRLLAFMARTMYRIHIAHHEAVTAQDNEREQRNTTGSSSEHASATQNNNNIPRHHADLRCIPIMQPCVDYEVSAYRFNRNRVDATMFTTTREKAEEYSRATEDNALMVPPGFATTKSFASLAIKEYISGAGTRFVSLCVASTLERFSSTPVTLQPMSLQHKQFWAAEFLKQLRGTILDDAVSSVLPIPFKIVVSLIWHNFERERQRNPSVATNQSSSGGFLPTQQNNSANAKLDEVTVAGGFLFGQFLEAALKDPLGEGLVDSELSAIQKRNLEDVTCLIECVLTQSDLPLKARSSFSEAECRFLRRFVDNEMVDANRMIRSIIYPDIATDDPEDDGTAVPDFFPPPVPGEFGLGTVSLLPNGDPRTVDSFWQRYVLKMPIDLHNMKLLHAFSQGLRFISLQALTAAFVPQLHPFGTPSSVAGTPTTTSGGGVYGSGGYAISGNAASSSGGGGAMSMNNASIVFNGGGASFAIGGASALQFVSGGGLGATLRAASPNAAATGTGMSSSASPIGGRSGRMRSATLIRAESQAQERTAAADVTIQRLTAEVKILREQLQQAKQAELETRVNAARAMEHFSHSYAIAMSRSARDAAAVAGVKSPTRRGSNNQNHNSNKTRNGKATNNSDFSSDTDTESSDAASSFAGSLAGSISPRKAATLGLLQQSMAISKNPLNSNSNNHNNDAATSFDLHHVGPSNAALQAAAAVLSPEARWRHSLDNMPLQSRSTRGAGTESVFGCPMDAQCLAFLALPKMHAPPAAPPTSSSSQQQQQQQANPHQVQPVPLHNPLQQQRRSDDAELTFSNFSFHTPTFQLDPQARR